MLDDNKRQDRVPVNLTEREFRDLCRLAVAQDRKPAEMAHFIIRERMYGSVGMSPDQRNENGSAE
jgi:hypothetical protein